MAPRLLPLEHRILRTLRACEVERRNILVAVSGGVDSIACLSILVRLNPLLKNKVSVVHIHHGRGEKRQINEFRNAARALVKKAAQARAVNFYSQSYRGKTPLRSEKDLRDFRWGKIRRLMKSGDLIATGHNANDLLETRLLRLLRGTGWRGLPAMDPSILRPLLEVSRNDILEYARLMGLVWIEDPSNSSLDPQRNWLRHVWLPQLREKWPSAERTLARSLDIIASEWSRAQKRRRTRTTTKGLVTNKALSRPKFLALSRDEKTACLADYLLQIGIRDYTRGQILEIWRQLDSPRRRYEFTTARTDWVVTPKEIRGKIKK